MSVNKVDRRESKNEFDNTYFKVYDDAVNLFENSFGADKDIREKEARYINLMGAKIINIVNDMGTFIRIANSIFPHYQSELEQRRIAQGKAIGLCHDLLTKYQIIMNRLRIPDDKYTDIIKRLIHEANCLRNWRKSDDKRFEGKLG